MVYQRIWYFHVFSHSDDSVLISPCFLHGKPGFSLDFQASPDIRKAVNMAHEDDALDCLEEAVQMLWKMVEGSTGRLELSSA